MTPHNVVEWCLVAIIVALSAGIIIFGAAMLYQFIRDELR